MTLHVRNKYSKPYTQYTNLGDPSGSCRALHYLAYQLAHVLQTPLYYGGRSQEGHEVPGSYLSCRQQVTSVEQGLEHHSCGNVDSKHGVRVLEC